MREDEEVDRMSTESSTAKTCEELALISLRVSVGASFWFLIVLIGWRQYLQGRNDKQSKLNEKVNEKGAF